jgi:hypothetical protein
MCPLPARNAHPAASARSASRTGLLTLLCTLGAGGIRSCCGNGKGLELPVIRFRLLKTADSTRSMGVSARPPWGARVCGLRGSGARRRWYPRQAPGVVQADSFSAQWPSPVGEVYAGGSPANPARFSQDSGQVRGGLPVELHMRTLPPVGSDSTTDVRHDGGPEARSQVACAMWRQPIVVSVGVPSLPMAPLRAASRMAQWLCRCHTRGRACSPDMARDDTSGGVSHD